MRLDYTNSTTDPKSERCAVLEFDEHRVELYIKRRDDKTYTLACLAGPTHDHPNKVKLQGPYHSLAQAKAAVNAILNALAEQRYQSSHSTPIWSIHAQSAVNSINKENSQSEGKYDFDPKDVFFEHDKSTDD